jgi:hypothetical protein
VLVGEGEEIGGDGALVGLFEPRQSEGSRLEETRCRVRHRWRLVRMKRTTIVLGRAKLVSEGRLEGAEKIRMDDGGHTCLEAVASSSAAAHGFGQLGQMTGQRPEPAGAHQKRTRAQPARREWQRRHSGGSMAGQLQQRAWRRGPTGKRSAAEAHAEPWCIKLPGTQRWSEDEMEWAAAWRPEP